MIELLIVFMELVMTIVGAVAKAIMVAIMLLMTATAYGFRQVVRMTIRLAINFIAGQVDKLTKDILYVPTIPAQALGDEVCEVSHD
jgi:hypothetical protein